MAFDYPIQMVDLKGQYKNIKSEIDNAISIVVNSASFINGPAVKEFSANLATYLGVKHVIPCANGTDALQIAFMALNLMPDDEVIVPGFTYVATAEVIALLGLKPIIVDVNADNFNINLKEIEKHITPKTKAIIPVHLFGQSTDMEGIMVLAKKYNLYVIEDNAQAIGSNCIVNGIIHKTGTIGHIGCTSFFPSKNLGCYGDGGAIFTNDDDLAIKLSMIANHGQSKKYFHQIVGVNSRLDTLQAAILNVKLKYLDEFCAKRIQFADHYDARLSNIKGIEIPKRDTFSTHVFHQYTLKVAENRRDDLIQHLKNRDIPSMIYYPLPLYTQGAFEKYFVQKLPITEVLCKEVMSLPIHTEYDAKLVDYICDVVIDFFG
jgi:UDP-2-acetamido-2-deoxy-ribo-hexuluronate aminotransferase